MKHKRLQSSSRWKLGRWCGEEGPERGSAAGVLHREAVGGLRGVRSRTMRRWGPPHQLGGIPEARRAAGGSPWTSSGVPAPGAAAARPSESSGVILSLEVVIWGLVHHSRLPSALSPHSRRGPRGRSALLRAKRQKQQRLALATDPNLFRFPPKSPRASRGDSPVPSLPRTSPAQNGGGHLV